MPSASQSALLQTPALQLQGRYWDLVIDGQSLALHPRLLSRFKVKKWNSNPLLDFVYLNTATKGGNKSFLWAGHYCFLSSKYTVWRECWIIKIGLRVIRNALIKTIKFNFLQDWFFRLSLIERSVYGKVRRHITEASFGLMLLWLQHAQLPWLYCEYSFQVLTWIRGIKNPLVCMMFLKKYI